MCSELNRELSLSSANSSVNNCDKLGNAENSYARKGERERGRRQDRKRICFVAIIKRYLLAWKCLVSLCKLCQLQSESFGQGNNSISARKSCERECACLCECSMQCTTPCSWYVRVGTVWKCGEEEGKATRLHETNTVCCPDRIAADSSNRPIWRLHT